MMGFEDLVKTGGPSVVQERLIPADASEGGRIELAIALFIDEAHIETPGDRVGGRGVTRRALAFEAGAATAQLGRGHVSRVLLRLQGLQVSNQVGDLGVP